jgi:hypothetical protein
MQVGPKIRVASKPHVLHDEAIHDKTVLIAGQAKTNIGQRAISKMVIPLSTVARRCGLRIFHESVTAEGRTDDISLFRLALGSHVITSFLDEPLQKSDFAVSMGPDGVSGPSDSSFNHCKCIQGR